jgi:ParB family chromosome partitioning protein
MSNRGNYTLAISTFDGIFSGESETLQTDSVICVPLGELREYQGHPFQVNDDADMRDLVESVQQHGVMVPCVVRSHDDGGYEIIAGHRRRRACELAGLPEIPVIVRALDDDEAAIVMVDSNLQREVILPSEKAWAYRIKLEAMKRQSGRKMPNVPAQGKSSALLAEQTGESKNQIYRYIRLTELNRELLDLVDAGRLTLVTAVELSYLSPEHQEIVSDLLNKGIAVPALTQAQKLREESEKGASFTTAVVEAILMDRQTEKPPKVLLKADKLKQYFPQTYTAEQMEETILQLLEEWRKTAQ